MERGYKVAVDNTAALVAENDGHADVIIEVKCDDNKVVFLGDSTVSASNGYRLTGEHTGYQTQLPAETVKLRLGPGQQLYAVSQTVPPYSDSVYVLVTNV